MATPPTLTSETKQLNYADLLKQDLLVLTAISLASLPKESLPFEPESERLALNQLLALEAGTPAANRQARPYLERILLVRSREKEYRKYRAKLNELISLPEAVSLKLVQTYNEELRCTQHNLQAHLKELRNCKATATDAQLKLSLCEQAIASLRKEITALQTRLKLVCDEARERKQLARKWIDLFEEYYKLLREELTILATEDSPVSPVVAPITLTAHLSSLNPIGRKLLSLRRHYSISEVSSS